MSNKKKKKPIGLSSEARERIEQAVARITADLAAADPVGVFDAALAGVPDLGADIIERLAKTRTQEVLNFLCGVSPFLADKALQKAARKAIYSLEQTGLKPPDNVRPQSAPVIRSPEKRFPRGFLGAYDFEGVRLGVLALPAEPTGYEVAVFLCDHKTGLRDFSSWHTGPGEFKKMIEQLNQNSPSPLTEVPPEAVRYVLAEAAETTQADGRYAGDDYAGFLLAANRVEKPARPVAYDLITSYAEVPGDTELPLWDHPFLQGLLIREELYPHLAKMDESETSVLVLTPAQKEERRQALLEKAREDVFTPERRTLLRRQLEETALLLWQSGMADMAEAALDAAGKVETPAGEPSLTEIFDRSVMEVMGPAGLNAPEETLEDTLDGGSGLIMPGR